MLVSLVDTTRRFLPRRLAIPLRRGLAQRRRARIGQHWPIRSDAGQPPPDWPGWPEGKRFAFVLTHDVDTAAGLARCHALAELERERGVRSAFYFVPEGRYTLDEEMRRFLVNGGWEIGVHGLYHEWRTFLSRRVFERHAPRIRAYLDEWGASGFRAPSMVRNLDWIGELGMAYDASSYDNDPFEPQADSAGTIFPYWIQSRTAGARYVELPYTLPQDHALFVILKEEGPALWKKKIDWIAEQGGMAMLIVHPDYLSLNGRQGLEEYPVAWYLELIDYVQQQYAGQYWSALPRDVAGYYRSVAPEQPARSRRKVAMAAYAFYRNDNRIIRYAETLAAAGDRVEVIALRSPGEPREEIINGVHVTYVQTRERNERGAISYLWRMLMFLFRSSWTLSWRALCRPYDVVHVHSVPDFEVFAAWLPRLRGARIILDIHDIVPEFYASKFGAAETSWAFRALLWAERISVRFSHHVIISNHLWHQRLLDRGVPAEKCTPLPNYVDSRIFFPHERTRNGNRFVIIYPGGLQRHQGLDVAIQAFALVAGRIPNSEFHIWGDGPERQSLQASIDALGLGGRISLKGRADLHQVPALLANADLGVVPKMADGFGNEAYSTKVLEMMSQGLPVVISQTRIDQYYFPEETVGFFNPGDPEDMARVLLELAEDPERRRQLSERGRAHAAENSWERKQGIYLNVIATRSAALA